MGQLQGADFKTEAELVAAGATKAELLKTTQVYDPVLMKTLSQAIDDGDLSGGSGGINFIENGDAEGTVTNFVKYTASVIGSRPSGTLNTGAALVNFSIVNTQPLFGEFSYEFQKLTGNAQGQGVYFPFTVQDAHMAKAIGNRLDYIVTLATGYVPGSNNPQMPIDSSVIIYIHDVTNNVFIEPSNFRLDALPLTFGEEQSGTWQSNPRTLATPAEGTSYRFLIHVARTETAPFTIKFDNIQVGPEVYRHGSPVTDYISYIPTLSNIVLGNGTLDFQYKRDGDSILINGTFQAGTTTTFTPGQPLGFSLPPGMVIDTEKISSTQLGEGPIGIGSVIDTGAQNYAPFSLRFIGGFLVLGSTQANGTYVTSGGLLTSTNVFAIGATDTINISSNSLPILGQSSSVQTSDQTDTRVVSARVTPSVGQSIPSATQTKLTLNVVNSDTHGFFNTALSRYVVGVPGSYEFEGCISYGPTAATYELSAQLFKNGVIVAAQASAKSGTGAVPHSTAFQFKDDNVKAGDFFELYTVQDSGAALSTRGNNTAPDVTVLNIKRLSGPSAIAASETVSLTGRHTAGQSIPSSLYVDIDINVLGLNTHGSYRPGAGYNSTTGVWTTPPAFIAGVAGKFYAMWNALFANASVTAAKQYAVAVAQYRNGSQIDISYAFNFSEAALTVSKYAGTVGYEFNMLAGDEIRFQVYHGEATNRSLNPTVGNNATIFKVGI